MRLARLTIYKGTIRRKKMNLDNITEDWEPTEEFIQELGIEHLDIFNDDEINEILKMSMQRIGRQEKLDRLGGSMAARLAKDKNDPDYKKMIKYKTLWKKFKEKVMRKYAVRGKQAARKAAMKTN
jgi:hypothetical protein